MRPLFIGLSLIFFQQITGQPSVLYYAGKMFEQAGLKMGQQSAGIAGLLGAFKLLMTCEHLAHPASPAPCLPGMPKNVLLLSYPCGTGATPCLLKATA